MVIRKTLEATTQLALDLDSDNRAIPKRHHKSRFPFFKHPRFRDEFHADNFYRDVRSAQNHTCAQMFTGNETGHWEVHPMKKESHVLQSLQDFVRSIGVLPTLKRENARTQTGNKWTDFERQLCMNGLMTEPHSP